MQAKSPELKQLLRQRYGTDHHTAIHVLATQQPPYGPSVRLALRWLASRSLSNHFTLEAIELMVAHAWTEALAGRGVRAPPGSALGGFLRYEGICCFWEVPQSFTDLSRPSRFLLLLGSFPWDDEPLIVDLGGSMTLTDRQGAADAFAAAQHTKSHRSSLFIATSYDGRERLDQPWTGDGPEHSVLLVARAAAMASAEGLLAYLRSGGDSHAWKNVLRPSPPRFDICLSIAQGLCFGRKPAMSGSKALEIRARGCAAMRIPAFKNLSVQTKHLLVDFDPVRSLVREMERLYGHLMIVFWNATTKSNIGIVWRPQVGFGAPFSYWIAQFLKILLPYFQAFLASPFKPLQSRYAIYIGDGQVVPNAPELLLELKSIGGDMVDALTF
jgi:U3 small nucleolar RNA-associated protein 22